MKIFVTVGTTSFDKMIEKVDNFFLKESDFNVTFQIADGKYIPVSGKYFSYTDKIYDYYNEADVVITHAGAGTIYTLLEMEKKIIAIPNLERIDKHQKDLAKYMESNNYLMVCWDYENLPFVIGSIRDFTPSKYKKNHFFKYDEIVDFVVQSYLN